MIGQTSMTGPASSSTPLLEVRDLTVRFAVEGGAVNAVNGISYIINAGETVGLVGESGCGKSVSALSLMRLVSEGGRIVGGQVLFQGRDLLRITEREIRRVRGNDIAMIFQDPMTSLNPVLTVGRQITEVLDLHQGLRRSEARRRAAALLELVEIPAAAQRLDDYPHQFSGGMRQRVMIAVALACDPKLIIADEPTTALDVTIQAQILELLRKIQAERGMAMLLITHDLGVVAGLADNVLVMYAGRIVESATPQRIFSDPRHPYTLGLLRSIPRLHRPRQAKLIPIEGAPPDLMSLPRGCAFAPRCPYLLARCHDDRPNLETKVEGHRAACWADMAPSAKAS